MKIKLMLKDPDGVYESVKEAVIDSLPEGLSRDEREDVIRTRMENAWDVLRKWVEFQEYVRIEIDTDAGTARVLEFDT